MPVDGFHQAIITSFNQAVGLTTSGGHRGPTTVNLRGSISDEEVNRVLSEGGDPLDLLIEEEEAMREEEKEGLVGTLERI